LEFWIVGGVALVFVAVILVVIFLLRPRKPVEAIEEPRSRYQQNTMMIDREVDEEVMNKRFLCPKCSSEVYYDEAECPSCGTRFVNDEFECPSCSKQVDPREKECPYCGEILMEEPYVCPNCSSPVSPESTRCDKCKSTFWSPIRLDQRSLDKRKSKAEIEPEPQPKEEQSVEDRFRERLHPGRGRRYR